MKIFAMLVALTMVAASLPEGDGDVFPTERLARFALRDIDNAFRKADSDKDCWSGFVPLLSRVVKFQHAVPAKEIEAVESLIVSRFSIYAFAGEYDKCIIKANFDGRLECVRLLSELSLVQSDTNSLFKLSEWLSRAVPLAADYEMSGKELAEAMRIDDKMIYGDNLPPSYPSSVGNITRCGPMWRECREKFRFRRLYNDRLPKFRVAALAAMRGAIMKGYENKTEEEREAIWEEFCRRAKATPDERKKAEE